MGFVHDTKMTDKRVSSSVPVVLYVHPIEPLKDGERIRLCCAGVFPNEVGDTADSFFVAQEELDGSIRIDTHIADFEPERCDVFTEFSRATSKQRLLRRLKNGGLSEPIRERMYQAFKSLIPCYSGRSFFSGQASNEIYSVTKGKEASFEKTYKVQANWIKNDRVALYKNFVKSLFVAFRDKEAFSSRFLQASDLELDSDEFFSEDMIALNKFMILSIRNSIKAEVTPSVTTFREEFTLVDSDCRDPWDGVASILPTTEGLAANTACMFKREVEDYFKIIDRSFTYFSRHNNVMNLPHPMFGNVLAMSKHELWTYWMHMAQPQEVFLGCRYTMASQALACHAISKLIQNPGLAQRLLKPDWDTLDRRVLDLDLKKVTVDYSDQVDLSFVLAFELAMYVEARRMKDDPKFSFNNVFLPEPNTILLADLFPDSIRNQNLPAMNTGINLTREQATQAELEALNKFATEWLDL